jgi:hypothetical protein
VAASLTRTRWGEPCPAGLPCRVGVCRRSKAWLASLRASGPVVHTARRGARELAAALAALAVAWPLAAQQPRALQIGAPVRVSGLDVPGGVVTGLLAGVTRDTVLIGVPNGTEAVRIARAAVSHLFLQIGRRSGSGHAALIGIVVGTAAGSVMAFVERNRLTTPGVFVVAGGAGGVMIGGLVGQFIFRVPRWQEVPLGWLDDMAAEP